MAAMGATGADEPDFSAAPPMETAERREDSSPGLDLSGVNLNGMDLSAGTDAAHAGACDVSGVDLSGCDLSLDAGGLDLGGLGDALASLLGDFFSSLSL